MAGLRAPRLLSPRCRVNRWSKLTAPLPSCANNETGDYMTITAKWSRRNFMAGVSSLSAMLLGPRRLSAAAAAAAAPKTTAPAAIKGFGQSGSVYEELGMATVINGQGTMTYLGGSLARP